MPIESVIFSRGISTGMPTSIVPGTFLIQTDTGAMFLDDTTASRIQIKDTTKLSLTGGTLTGDLFLSGNKLGLGTSDQDVGIQLSDTNQVIVSVDSTGFALQNGSDQIFSATPVGINVFNKIITNVPTPTNAVHAANKQYVDIAFTELESEIQSTISAYLPLKGGTMTGNIEMSGNHITSTVSISDVNYYAALNLSGPSAILSSSQPGVTNQGSIQVSSAGRVTLQSTGSSDNTTTLLLDNNSTISINASVITLNATSGVNINNVLNMSNYRIQNLAEPELASDAATKQYVDTHTGGGGGTGDYLPLTGGNLTGPVTSSSTIGSNVTSSGSSILNGNTIELSAGSEQGSITFTDEGVFTISLDTPGTSAPTRIRNVLNPSLENDAANKQYVDTSFNSVISTCSTDAATEIKQIQRSTPSTNTFFLVGFVSGNTITSNLVFTFLNDTTNYNVTNSTDFSLYSSNSGALGLFYRSTTTDIVFYGYLNYINDGVLS